MPALRDARLLVLSLVLSVAVHAAILLIVHPREAIDRRPAEVLTVTLQALEPPRVIPPPEIARPRSVVPQKLSVRKDKDTPRAKAPAAPVTPEPVRTQPEAPSILALPEAAAPRAPAGPEPDTVPRSPAPAAEAPVRGEIARSGPPMDKPAAVTAPSFSAAYLKNPPPRYPISARRRGEQGTVTLRVFVTREGIPARVALETTSGAAALDEAALDAVKSWRFVPARQGGQAVDAWVLVPIVFRLDSGS